MSARSDLGIYVHWPFCRSKCPYCDFNSHVADAIDEPRWRDALVRDLNSFAAETTGRTVGSIYFGGGTPSLMSPTTVGAVIDAVAARWLIAADAEITAEANPTSAEAGRFKGFRQAGVNRLSIGVQSLDDHALRFLGRHHSAAEACAAIAIAQACFPRLSFDLIYGLPGQTVPQWAEALAVALGLADEHMSVYQLTIEPGTAFFRDKIETPGEDVSAELFEVTADMLERAGLPAYEISNYARMGRACRHNLEIWRGGDYLGIGPGAHGRLAVNGAWFATRQIHSPEKWLRAVEHRRTGMAVRQELSVAERAEELLLSGLRLTDGVEHARFEAMLGIPVAHVINHDALTALIEGGDLVADGVAIRATAQGRLRLNAMLAALIA